MAGRVTLAKVPPLVVFPSAAYEPPCRVVDSTARPPVVVHDERSPDSNPSAKTAGAGVGVVAVAVFDLAEVLPATSTDWTA